MTAPSRDQTVAAGTGAPVEVRWDTWGVPHITAQTPADLYYALGYVSAQQHLWRLEYCRRQARGQLAALLGPKALASDREMLTLGIGAHAGELATRLPPDEAAVLSAYAAGVNRWIDQARGTDVWPIELKLLKVDALPAWTPADSIACWKQRWWTVTGRVQNIVIGELARRYLPPDLHDAFMATELGEETIVPSAGSGSVPGGADSGEGSNNWAVAGSLTTTGYPVLCSDPHNPFSQPSQWLEAHLSLADGSLEVLGPTYISWPGVYMGRNRRLAWGVTNHVASVRDLYREMLDPAQPGRYREGDTWRDLVVEEHVIQVRDAEAERLTVRRTCRGPLVGHWFQSVLDDHPVLSMRWTGTEVGTGLTSMLALNAAKSVEEGIQALAGWPCSVMNVLLADTSGSIAYHVAGFIPRVKEAARRLRDAADPDDSWQDFLPFESLAHLENPARGWLASANQPPWRTDPPGMSYLGGAAWADGGRMRRIRQRLEARTPMTPEEAGAIQADITSLRAKELVPVVLRLLGDIDDDSAGVRDALRKWDGRYVAESIAPTLWTAFWERWTRRVAAMRFPQEAIAMVTPQAGAVARSLLLSPQSLPGWLDGGDLAVEIGGTWADTLAWLRDLLGPDPAGWLWGAVHHVTWEHPLDGVPGAQPARPLSVGPFPTTGGPTVRAAGYAAARPFAVTGGATYRLVADLSPGGALLATTTTGNSGHPDDPHYADQAPLWVEDRYHSIQFEGFDVEATTRLVLQ